MSNRQRLQFTCFTLDKDSLAYRYSKLQYVSVDRSVLSAHPRGENAAAAHDPTFTPQEESNAPAFQRLKDDRYPSSTTLGPGKIEKTGADLVTEIAVCVFGVLITVPFVWLAVAMVEYYHREATNSDTYL